MLGVFYLFICIVTGYMFCKLFFPKLIARAYVKRENGSLIKLPAYYVLLPAWYITGTMIVTWLVYLVAYICRNEPKPLIYGNVIVLGMLAAAFALFYAMEISRHRIKKIDIGMLKEFFWNGDYTYSVYAGIVLWFCIVIMYKTFFVADGVLNTGTSVVSDFGAHISMIRSFSFGNNFPTQYPYYGGEDIRYHFMHDFLAGNLEFLGLRIDHAFNLPSIMNLFCTYLLLFTLTVNIFKCRLTAWIGGLLFTFRSSFSVFRFLGEDRTGNALQNLLTTGHYFNYTEHEVWGFWCTRVFCNQRHFAFGITALLLALIIFLPYLWEMGENLVQLKKEGVVVLRTRAPQTDEEDGEEREPEMIRVGLEPTWLDYVRICFFSKDSFAVKDPVAAVGTGLFLGALAFWHGSALIATLGMLFFMAAFSVCRLDYLITALISVVLAVLQSRFFIFGEAVKPQYVYGFLADNKTVFGTIQYVVMLTGITLLIAAFGMLLVRGTARYMFLVVLVPFVMSFYLSLTPDIGVNHKWVIISLMLVSMFTAHFVSSLYRQPGVVSAILATCLIVILTATGAAELVIQKNEDRYYTQNDLDSNITMWLKENVGPKDIVFGSTAALDDIVMSGRMFYLRHLYCVWSAGYDSRTRFDMAKKIYYSTDPSTLAYYVYKADIDYIIMDHDARDFFFLKPGRGDFGDLEPDEKVDFVTKELTYEKFEELLSKTYKEVYSEGDPLWGYRVFDTNQPIYNN